MLNWLRNRLRKWFAEEQRVDVLECYIDNRIVRMSVCDSVGLKLMVTDGMGTWLVGPEECLRRSEFWRAWDQRTKDDLVWEDGTKFKPEGNST